MAYISNDICSELCQYFSLPLYTYILHMQDHVAKGDGELKTMALFTRSRLSVQPVSQRMSCSMLYPDTIACMFLL